MSAVETQDVPLSELSIGLLVEAGLSRAAVTGIAELTRAVVVAGTF